MSPILFASKNKGKIKEVASLMQNLDIELVMPSDVDIDLHIEEIGTTYAANAALKAKAFCHASGLITFADDSGLEVDVLDGAPGLYSARYAPWDNATDADRRDCLVNNLLPYPHPWLARFRCVVAIASPNEEIHYSEGICPGEIIPEERGNRGFGYDPIFMVPSLGRTMAELTMSEKNLISHRSRAVQAAQARLIELSKRK
jgi:XTP/dITP diphosphohydrolase